MSLFDTIVGVFFGAISKTKMLFYFSLTSTFASCEKAYRTALTDIEVRCNESIAVILILL